MRIVVAESAEQVEFVRTLLKEYALETEVDLSFQDFASEVANLPGKYSPPEGRLLLAQSEIEWLGCVGLRKIGDGICEMKRLYVRPQFRESGVGRLLATAVINAAAKIGYQAMRLDTLSTMTAAIALYESLGFRRIAPYYHNPYQASVFMELRLTPAR